MPWVVLNIQHLIRKCHAVHDHYKRNWRIALCNEFLDLRQEIEERSVDARSAFLRGEMTVALDEKQDI